MSKNFNNLEWEYIHKTFAVTSRGEFDHRIGELTITRNNSLELKIEAKGKITHDFTAVTSGEEKQKIRLSSEIPVVKISAGTNLSGEIRGGIITETIYRHPENHIIQTCYPEKIIICFDKSAQRKKCWLIEWLVNVKTDYLFPCHNVKETKTTLTISKYGQSIYKTDSSSYSSTDGHIQLSLNAFEQAMICFGKIHGNAQEQQDFFPGFISYQITDGNAPSEEAREKVKHALSFALGRPIGSIGYTIYDENWEIVETCAVNLAPPFGNTKIFSSPSFPPSPLAENITSTPCQINPHLLNKTINAFYSHYDEYNFQYVMWQYLHAFFAPLNMRPLFFYAIIEGIIKRDKLKPVQKIRDQEKIYAALKECGLEIGALEKTALPSRHYPAHGEQEKDPIKIIEHTRVLQVLCNRFLLKITKASDAYIDYCSFEKGCYHPCFYCIQDISKAVGAPISSKKQCGECRGETQYCQ